MATFIPEGYIWVWTMGGGFQVLSANCCICEEEGIIRKETRHWRGKGYCSVHWESHGIKIQKDDVRNDLKNRDSVPKPPPPPPPPVYEKPAPAIPFVSGLSLESRIEPTTPVPVKVMDVEEDMMPQEKCFCGRPKGHTGRHTGFSPHQAAAEKKKEEPVSRLHDTSCPKCGKPKHSGNCRLGALIQKEGDLKFGGNGHRAQTDVADDPVDVEEMIATLKKEQTKLETRLVVVAQAIESLEKLL